jgi:TrkA family protein
VAVVLLLAIVAGSYFIVRIGAVVLELTGIDRERAQFQALSAFTNSGFTTRESEEMVRHPVRRRIISVLMILGHAGMVTTIGTFAASLLEGTVGATAWHIGAPVLAFVLVMQLLRWRGVTRKVHDALQRWLAARYDFHAPSTEEMLRVHEGFGVRRVRIHADSPIAGRYLRELDLRPRRVQVLAIERGERFIAVPAGDDRLEAGDVLVVYGTEGGVGRVFQADATSPLKTA